MSVSPIDSDVLGGLFATPAMREVFSDRARFQRLLDVEAALARAEAGLGLIPEAAARTITERADVRILDLDAMRAGTELAGYPIVPLVRQLAAASGEEAGRWVHWGATTQDIIDTGLVLQMRDGLRLIDDELGAIEAALADLARRHRDTPMAGRTHLQHALPITFGFRCAVWLDALQRHAARLRELRARVLVVQFGGAVGTLASLGGQGLLVAEALARELDLDTPAIAWHTSRDRVAEVATFLGLVTGSLAKMAQDIALLMQTEIDEVREPHLPGRGGSSTMPQKRNPIASECVLAAAANARQLVPVVLGAMVADHERATGPWHAEWLALPQLFALTSGALHHTRAILEGLEVDAGRMRANLDLTAGTISAEAVMMALAPHIGRQDAHHVVAEACRTALAEGRALLDVLSAVPEVTGAISADRLRDLLEPGNYTGLAATLVDRVLAAKREE